MKKLLSTIKGLASCVFGVFVSFKKNTIMGRTGRVYGGSGLARVGRDSDVRSVIGRDEAPGTLDGGVGAIRDSFGLALGKNNKKQLTWPSCKRQCWRQSHRARASSKPHGTRE